MNSRAVLGIVVLALPLACGAQSSAPSSEASPSSPPPSAGQPQTAPIVAGRFIHKKDPKYPKEAKKRRLHGPVTLQATVEENGTVTNLAILEGDPLLGDAATDAVLGWRFDPYTQNGTPVKVLQKLTFTFDPHQKVARLEENLSPPTLWTSRPVIARKIFRVGGGVSAPRVVYNPNPSYTEKARKAKYQGTSILSLIVGDDGLPRDIKVARALGQGLDAKAVEAVQQWRFKPAMKDGKPVAVAINVEVQFRLY